MREKIEVRYLYSTVQLDPVVLIAAALDPNLFTDISNGCTSSHGARPVGVFLKPANNRTGTPS